MATASRPSPSALYRPDALFCWFSLPTRLAAFKRAKAERAVRS